MTWPYEAMSPYEVAEAIGNLQGKCDDYEKRIKKLERLIEQLKDVDDGK